MPEGSCHSAMASTVAWTWAPVMMPSTVGSLVSDMVRLPLLGLGRVL
jgi:hypothetical protein